MIQQSRKKTPFLTRILRLRNQLGFFWPLILGQASLVVVSFCAVFGYMYIEGWNFWDSCYMVVITLSTIGYGEVHPLSGPGRILTTFVILTGVGNFAFLLGAFSQLLVEGRLFKLLGRRRVLKTIGDLNGHCIICGYGRIGSVVAGEIREEGLDIVVLENEPKALEKLEEEGILHIAGDATSDDVLKEAGIDRAKSLIASLSEDSQNVYVVLSARQLNKDLSIIARAGSQEHVSKLKLAGANVVLMPNRIGGVRMAQSVLRPTVTSFMELAHTKSTQDIQMEELTISETSELVGKNLIESGIRPRFNLIIIAIKKIGQDMTFNPEPKTVLHAGDTVIAVGSTKNFELFEEIL